MDLLIPFSVLRENDNLALVYPVDLNKSTFKLYFFRVMRRYLFHLVYDKMTDVSPGGSWSTDVYLGDNGIASGDDQLVIWDERPFRLYHFSIGISHPDFRVWKFQPAGVLEGSMARKKATQVGGNYDFVDGKISPFNRPTMAGETVIHNKLSFTICWTNMEPRTIKPILNFVGAGYDVIKIEDEVYVNMMLRGQKPCRYVTVGGLAFFQYNVPDEWGDGVTVDQRILTAMRG